MLTSTRPATTAAARVLRWTALLFFVSGLFHIGVWLAEGMPSLVGSVTWRKPITFGFSTAVLFLSLSWVLNLLPARTSRDRQAWLFAVLLILEVGLIDMQQWRGVASHFNTATPFDGAVFNAMGALIMTASVIMALWTRDVFREPLATSPAYTWAIRAGMVMLNAGNLIGLVMSVTETTALKPLHGAALHVLQALPVAVWLLGRLRYPPAWHEWLVSSQRCSPDSLQRLPHS
jgi:hypothetical protein